jgi:peptidoglycan/LPS O-acetylase OafA/YrhL
MNNQLPALTSLRGIAALFILTHHTLGVFLPETGQNIGQFTSFIKKSYLWVDFFFMLSGYVLMHVYHRTFETKFRLQRYKEFIVARFSRLYPLHLTILLSFICLAFFQSAYHTGPGFTGVQSLLSLLTNLTLLQALHFSSWNEPAWAISAQWLIYFLIPFIIFFSKRTSLVIDAAVIVLSFTVLFILNWWMGHLDFVGWRSLIRCGVEMMTGVLVYKFQSNLHWKRYLPAGGLTVGLTVIVLVLIFLPINHTLTVCIFPILIISASNLADDSVFCRRPLLFLGTISYSLYMIHWFFIMLFNTLSILVTGSALHTHFSLLQLYLIALVFIVFNIFIASLCFKFVELPQRIAVKKLIMERKFS